MRSLALRAKAIDPDPGSTAVGVQLRQLKEMSPLDLCEIARNYDWNRQPDVVLGWIMAQKCVDLATALSVFLAGDPMRFNYLDKRDVPAVHRGICSLLDAVCLRVNSGFYLPDPKHVLERAGRIDTWLEYQEADRQAERPGRWIFEDHIVRRAMGGGTPVITPQNAGATIRKPISGLFRRASH